ncbi:uncharacterized protein LOC124173565 [Ischnura elegans]|uniref:uncharacterized protein LOC124173565 n=1 Tax=Ischnura elegans TaxID=197161 RepID=UPI001ED8A2EA|nr:uncharacterized protein LOC124173565 [Ischnura elegans]
MASLTAVTPEVTRIMALAKQQSLMAISAAPSAPAVNQESPEPLPCQLATTSSFSAVPGGAVAAPDAAPEPIPATPDVQPSASSSAIPALMSLPSPTAAAAAKFARQALKDPRRAKTTSSAKKGR